MGNKQFDKGYEPHEVEKRWYEYWEKEHLFAAKDQSPQASYSIVIPLLFRLPMSPVYCTWDMR